METTQIVRGATMKVVSVKDAQGASDDDVAAYAMRAAGEDRSSLFGWRVERLDDGIARVALDID